MLNNIIVCCIASLITECIFLSVTGRSHSLPQSLNRIKRKRMILNPLDNLDSLSNWNSIGKKKKKNKN